MEPAYCVKQKKFTANAHRWAIGSPKNGKNMFYCRCAECGIMKTRFVKARGN